MKSSKFLLFVFCILSVSITVFAQNRELKVDEEIQSRHETTINGKKVTYTANVGTQPVWDANGKPIAALFYTYYEREGVQDRSRRPLVISFNGGPGSASVWMHIAYTGPRILNIDDEGYPVQPYGIKSNPYSILDVADIVFVNPVNTGYSRIVDHEVDRSLFFGVNEDITYLAEWLNTFVTRKNRWTSPKYLIGESYGTTRVSGLALALQEQQWMYLNGVILVSPTGLGIDRDGPIEQANRIPYFAAAAWYHNKLPTELQSKDLLQVLDEAEKFTLEELTPALTHGGFISEERRDKIADKMSSYSGISKNSILNYNLDVPKAFFWKELLREEGYTVGRLDSRYKGIDREDAGVQPDYNSELNSWLHSFTPAINYYFQNELKYKTDMKYNMFGNVHPWNRDGDRTGENLRKAMAMNPYLKVMVQSGYFDGATTYFNAKYTMWHIDPSGKLKNRLRFEGYRSGHMMYLRAEDLKSANDHLREFINSSLAADGKSAKY